MKWEEKDRWKPFNPYGSDWQFLVAVDTGKKQNNVPTGNTPPNVGSSNTPQSANNNNAPTNQKETKIPDYISKIIQQPPPEVGGVDVQEKLGSYEEDLRQKFNALVNQLGEMQELAKQGPGTRMLPEVVQALGNALGTFISMMPNTWAQPFGEAIKAAAPLSSLGNRLAREEWERQLEAKKLGVEAARTGYESAVSDYNRRLQAIRVQNEIDAANRAIIDNYNRNLIEAQRVLDEKEYNDKRLQLTEQIAQSTILLNLARALSYDQAKRIADIVKAATTGDEIANKALKDLSILTNRIREEIRKNKNLSDALGENADPLSLALADALSRWGKAGGNPITQENQLHNIVSSAVSSFMSRLGIKLPTADISLINNALFNVILELSKQQGQIGLPSLQQNGGQPLPQLNPIEDSDLLDLLNGVTPD